MIQVTIRFRRAIDVQVLVDLNRVTCRMIDKRAIVGDQDLIFALGPSNKWSPLIVLPKTYCDITRERHGEFRNPPVCVVPNSDVVGQLILLLSLKTTAKMLVKPLKPLLCGLLIQNQQVEGTIPFRSPTFSFATATRSHALFVSFST